jgi:hypothetical protein
MLRGTARTALVPRWSFRVDRSSQAGQKTGWRARPVVVAGVMGGLGSLLTGNLRADLGNASPYLRAIDEPFGTLSAQTVEDQQR